MLKVLQVDKVIDIKMIAGRCKALDLTNIIIANDEIANDEILSTIIKMSLPRNVKIAIKEVEAAGELLKDRLCEQIGIMTVVKNLKDALCILKSAACITEVNIGALDQLCDPRNKYGQNDSRDKGVDGELEMLHEIIRLMPDSTYQTDAAGQAVLLTELPG